MFIVSIILDEGEFKNNEFTSFYDKQDIYHLFVHLIKLLNKMKM
jgi:hypothetical protein